MSKTLFFYFTAALAVIMTLFFSGCMGKSQPPRFYTLTPLSEDTMKTAVAGSADIRAIGIGPVKLADYLNQSRIVTRSSDNMIKQAEFDQWSGSLRDNLINVMAENIGLQMVTWQVYIYPWRSYIPIDYQVTVDIVRFDGQPGKEVVLISRWTVLRGNDNELITTKRSDIHEQISGGGYQEFVAAQSRALARLSHEILEEIHAATLN